MLIDASCRWQLHINWICFVCVCVLVKFCHSHFHFSDLLSCDKNKRIFFFIVLEIVCKRDFISLWLKYERTKSSCFLLYFVCVYRIFAYFILIHIDDRRKNWTDKMLNVISSVHCLHCVTHPHITLQLEDGSNENGLIISQKNKRIAHLNEHEQMWWHQMLLNFNLTNIIWQKWHR